MCGRIVLGHLTWAQFRAWLTGDLDLGSVELTAEVQMPGGWNVPPTTQVPVVRVLQPGSNGLEGALPRWGLIPARGRLHLGEPGHCACE